MNAAEALVTLVQAIAFFAMVREIRSYLPILVGLVTGGLLAAPFAAWCCSRVPTKPLLVGVGLLITFIVYMSCYAYDLCYFLNKRWT